MLSPLWSDFCSDLHHKVCETNVLHVNQIVPGPKKGFGKCWSCCPLLHRTVACLEVLWAVSGPWFSRSVCAGIAAERPPYFKVCRAVKTTSCPQSFLVSLYPEPFLHCHISSGEILSFNLHFPKNGECFLAIFICSFENSVKIPSPFWGRGWFSSSLFFSLCFFRLYIMYINPLLDVYAKILPNSVGSLSIHSIASFAVQKLPPTPRSHRLTNTRWQVRETSLSCWPGAQETENN